MWRIIRLIFMGYWNDKPVHVHSWEVKDTLIRKTFNYSGREDKAKVYVMQCTECGEIKQVNIS